MRIVMLFVLATSLAACSGGGGPGDADRDGEQDAGAETGTDADGIPLDCGDDPRNWSSCMLGYPDGGPEWGLWCAGTCRPSCGPLLGLECPGSLVCRLSGTYGVCFPP